MAIRSPQRKIRGLTQEESKQIISQNAWVKDHYSNVGDWAKAASDLFTEMQDKTTGWFSSQTQSMYTQKLKKLYDQKDNWHSRFQGNTEATNTIDAIAEDLKNAQEVISQNGKYYSQWNSKEEYDDWNTYYGGDQATRMKNATANLEAKTKAKNDAYGQYNDHFNADVSEIDFMTYDSSAAEKKGKELLRAYQQAEKDEKEALKILWDAKYDTMTAAQLQAVMEGLQDKEEKLYVSTLQKNAKLTELKQEWMDLNAPFDPKSEHYDPAFLEKTFYSSTKLTDGSLGEMDTGYADIDYEFINGNPEISELIVGMDRNLYQVTEEEHQRYNYWKTYDREKGTNKAKRYLYLLQETLNARDSELDYAKIKDKTLLEIAYGLNSGLGKFGRAIDTLYRQPEEYIPKSSLEMTAEKAYHGLEDEGNVSWYNIKTGRWEEKIAGKSLGQHIFNTVEDTAYKLPSKAVEALISTVSPPAGATVSALLNGLTESGNAYQEMLNAGYTQKQAQKYGNLVGIGSYVADEAAGFIMENTVGDLMRDSPLGKTLGQEDWLNIAKQLQNFAEPYMWKAITGQSKPDTEKMQTAAKNAVTVKAMDKIFNRMKATPEELSLDLRRSLMDTLNDPEARKALAESGTFTSDRLDEIAAGLALAGDTDDAVGTYVGDVVYGENGFAMNKQYLQQIVDETLNNRDMILDADVADALMSVYIPQWKKNRKIY